jgi:hypothetical protein
MKSDNFMFEAIALLCLVSIVSQEATATGNTAFLAKV